MAKKENPVLRTPGAVDDTININNNTTAGEKNQEKIPSELRARNQWVACKMVPDYDKT